MTVPRIRISTSPEHTMHDDRNRGPVRNALLKWQLQQDKRRVAEVQHRLMRMAAPSPSSSLGLNSRSFDRRLVTRRPQVVHDKTHDKAALMKLSIKTEKRDKVTANHSIDDGFQTSQLEYPLPSVRSSKPPLNHSVQSASLHSTGTQLNAARDLYPPVQPQEVSNSISQACQNLAFSRIKVPRGSRERSSSTSPMAPSELSTIMSISQQTKGSTTQQNSGIESPATDVNGFLIPTSSQSIAEILASMERSTDVEYAAGDDQCYEVSTGDDRKSFSRDEISADDALIARFEALSGMEFVRCSMIVVACCLVIGTSGFFLEELIDLVGLFSKRTHTLLSRVEQEQMLARLSILQQKLQGFQLLTSKIEVRSQTVLAELRQYMDMIQLDREKHQEMLANEMQKLGRHILHVTHDLVEQEQESLRKQLAEVVKVQVIDVEGAGDDGVIIGAAGPKNDKQLDETTTAAPVQAESYPIMDESLHEAIAASTREDNGEHFRVKQTKVEPSHELVTKVDAAQNVDNEQAQIKFDENGHVPVEALSHVLTGELANSESKLESPMLVQGVNVEHTAKVESASSPALEQSLNKPEDSVASPSDITVNVMPSRNVSGVSWDGTVLLVCIVFLAACVVLRVYNANRHKRWFEERRRRRKQRALRLAQRRARAMAAYQEDRDEWHGDETDSDIEEVSLMTPIRDNEDDDSEPHLEHQSSSKRTSVQTCL